VRVFSSLVGEPPMGYLIGWRMTLAADTLRNTDATVAEVARQVGYHNVFSFSTAFKRFYGPEPDALVPRHDELGCPPSARRMGD
jgi:AraC-like DNA-binding protein